MENCLKQNVSCFLLLLKASGYDDDDDVGTYYREKHLVIRGHLTYLAIIIKMDSSAITVTSYVHNFSLLFNKNTLLY
jgi:hypothetical protein